MSTTHPDDLELFTYVEDDESDDAVAVHLVSCAECAQKVSELRTAREALREAPFLHLPPRRRDLIMGSLEPRRPRRNPFTSPKRMLAVLTPVAAVVVAVVALTGGGDKPDRTAAGGGGAAEAMKATTTTAQDEAGAATASQSAAAAPEELVRSVAGPPARVARLLRAAGLDARVAAGTVEVKGGGREAIRRALAGLADGPVRVVLRTR